MGTYNCPSSYNVSHVCYAVDSGFGVKQASQLFEGILLLFPFTDEEIDFQRGV